MAPHARPDTVAAIDPAARGARADNFDPRFDINNITVEHVLDKLAAQLDPADKQQSDSQ